MTLAITIFAAITAIVVLITKLIELQLAQVKLKELAANNPKISPTPATSITPSKTFIFRVGFILPLIFICVIVACFWTGWVSTRLGLGVVIFLSIATPFYAIMPFLFRMLGLIESLIDITDGHSKITGELVNLYSETKNQDTEQDVAEQRLL